MENKVDTDFINSFEIDDLTESIKFHSIEGWIKCNRWINMLPDIKEQLVKTDDETGYSYYVKHQKLFYMNEFTWENATADTYHLRKITEHKDTTIRTKNDEFYINWAYSNPRLYQEGFNTNLIQEYVSRPNLLYGVPIYDQALRIQCDLLQVFLVFHLKSDFKFHSKISGDKFKLMDPFTRMFIRNTNIKDPAIKAKYFNDTFNLKDFVFTLYTNYFPNVTWRYVGGGHFAHRITLQITEFMFQCGLFEFNDVENILKIILEKSENLVTLENCCLKDAQASRIQPDFQKTLSIIFSDMKYYISQIILHCIVLINDKCLLESNSFTQTKEPFDREEPWKVVYFKNQSLNNIINNIMMKYLMKDSLFTVEEFDREKPDTMLFIDEQTKVNLNNIFMMISDVDTDMFFVSQNLVTEELLNYRLNKNPDYQANGKPFKDEAKVIAETLKNFFNDIINCKLEDSQDTPIGTNFEKAYFHISGMVTNYFKSQSEEETYYKQLALNDHNIVGLLFFILKLQLDLNKDESMKITLDLLTKVCKDNFTTQGQMLVSPNIEIFLDLHHHSPLTGTIVTTKIFEYDNQVLYANPEIFQVLFELYKAKFREFDQFFGTKNAEELAYSSDEILHKDRLEWIFSLDTYNKYFVNLLSNPNSKGFKREKHVIIEKNHDVFKKLPNYDLIIQSFIAEFVSKYCLPILKDKDYLFNKFTLPIPGQSHNTFYIPILNNNIEDRSKILSMTDVILDKHTQTKSLLFDLATSFLKLLNKCSERIVYGKCLASIRETFPHKEMLPSYDHLFDIPEGLLVQNEILKLKYTYAFFLGNYLMTDREKQLKNTAVVYHQNVTIEVDFSTHVCREIQHLLSKLPQLSEQMSKTNQISDPKRKEREVLLIKNYVCEGLLPVIYMYLKNIHTTYFINNKVDNKKDLPQYKKSVGEVFEAFSKSSANLSHILGMTGDFNLNNELVTKRNDNNEIERSHVYVDTDMLNEQDRKTGKRIEIDRNLQDMDKEEIVTAGLYEMRKKCENLMDIIEKLYPNEMAYILANFVRFSANKRDFNNLAVTNIQGEGQNKTMQDYTDSKLNSKSRNGIKFKFQQKRKLLQNYNLNIYSKAVEEKIKKKKDKKHEKAIQSVEFKEFLKVKQLYAATKQEYLNKKGRDNIIFNYLSSNKDQIGNTLNFILGTICKAFKLNQPAKEGESDTLVTVLFSHQYLYPYLVYLDALISNYDEMKICLFYIWSDLDSEQDKNEKIWTQADTEFFSNDLKATINSEERKKDYKKILSVIYYLYCKLGQFCSYKTFQDNTWSCVWDKYFVMGSLMKNLCEDNASYFKKYLGRFQPQVESDKEFNTAKRNIVFDSYVRMESFFNSSLNWYMTDKKPCYADRPELNIMYIRWFEFITEFVNGPCPENQRMLYRYRGDIYTGILMRELDDVNNIFYTVKNRCLDYIFGLIEGEGTYPLSEELKATQPDVYLTTKYFNCNITPSAVINLIYKMTKRLFIYRKMENDPSFRTKLARLVNRRRELQVQKLKEAKLMTETDIIELSVKNKAYDRLFSVFENVDATVTEEMLDAVQFENYQDILDLYLTDPEFGNHEIIEISLKLYSFLMTLSKQSESTNLFLEQKKFKLGSYYGEELDRDDRASNKNILNSITNKMGKNSSKHNVQITEQEIFFMFILKISKKIEIQLQPPSFDFPITKIIYFQLEPETFYLEDNTKKQLNVDIDLENSRSDFMQRFPSYFIEMNNNYSLRLSNPFVFWISKNATFNLLKYLSYAFGLLLNIFVLLFFRLDEGNGTSADTRRITAIQWAKSLHDISSIVFGCICLTFLLIWILFRAYPEYQKSVPQYLLRNPDVAQLTFKHKFIIMIYWVFFSSTAPLNFMLHGIFGIVTYFSSPFVTSLHLLLLFNISTTAKYVIKAFTAHINQLAITLLLIIFTIWAFATFNANRFSGAYDIESVDGEKIDVCQNMFRCMIYNLNFGLRSGGGIADTHKAYAFDGDGTVGSNVFDEANFAVGGKVVGKMTFDLFFFIIINIVYLNIVFGIIIDTFGEMRTALDERAASLKSKCMICNGTPQMFEDIKVSFSHHTQVDHDIWVYLNYIFHLNKKHKSDYNGDEIQVMSQFENIDESWFPCQKTVYLNDYENDASVEYLVGKLQEKLEVVEGQNKSLEVTLNKMLEKQDELTDMFQKSIKVPEVEEELNGDLEV